MKYLITLISSILIFSNTSRACTMYKITKDGKTIVGNNEDWINANAQIWFVPAGENAYGVMNVGFDNDFAQGAVNDRGLVFDGFAMPHLKVKNTKGKTTINQDELIAPIMHSYASVIEVKEHLSKINLSILENSMLVFVDRTGKYLIVEGEELILGNDAEQSFSNFYPSLTSSREEVAIDTYQKGLTHIKTSDGTANLDYCSSVMNSFQQNFTQYSTIYDLEVGTVRLYHYQNFDDFIELDLAEELQKGEHKLSIPDLFPKDTKGFRYFETYNNADSIVSFYEKIYTMNSKDIAPEHLPSLKANLSQVLTLTADEWVKTNKDKGGAIKIYDLVARLSSDNKEVKKKAEKNIKRLSRELKKGG